MTGRALRPVTPVLLLLTLLAGGVLPPPASAQAPPSPAGQPEQDRTGFHIISIEFPGGRIAEYVESLRHAEPELNAVLDPEAAEVEMPAVSLKKVTLDTAIHLIQNTAAARENNISIQAMIQKLTPGNDVYVISSGKHDPRGPMPAMVGGLGGGPVRPGTEKRLQISSLRELIGQESGKESDSKTQTVLTAIETALSIQDPAGKEKAVVKYHADSALLIVQGTESQINTIEQVVEEMRRSARTQQQPNASQLAALRATLTDLQKEISALKEEIETLKKAVVKPAEKGSIKGGS